VWGGLEGGPPAEENGATLAHLEHMTDALFDDLFVHQVRNAFHSIRIGVAEKLHNGGHLVDGTKYAEVPVPSAEPGARLAADLGPWCLDRKGPEPGATRRESDPSAAGA
jgi:hypothetical protein